VHCPAECPCDLTAIRRSEPGRFPGRTVTTPGQCAVTNIGGRNDTLAEIAAILATGFAALRARPAAADNRARKAQEQAQLRVPSDSSLSTCMSSATSHMNGASPANVLPPKEME
jgi:hypothetical protein